MNANYFFISTKSLFLICRIFPPMLNLAKIYSTGCATAYKWLRMTYTHCSILVLETLYCAPPLVFVIPKVI